MSARDDFPKLTCIEGKVFPRSYPLQWAPELSEALDEIDRLRARARAEADVLAAAERWHDAVVVHPASKHSMALRAAVAAWRAARKETP